MYSQDAKFTKPAKIFLVIWIVVGSLAFVDYFVLNPRERINSSDVVTLDQEFNKIFHETSDFGTWSEKFKIHRSMLTVSSNYNNSSVGRYPKDDVLKALEKSGWKKMASKKSGSKILFCKSRYRADLYLYPNGRVSLVLYVKEFKADSNC